MTRELRLSDIADVREYERTRDDFRRRIIALKKRRRVSVGPFVTLLFENRETIRFQVQEMARVEKLDSDEAIAGELRAYNPLIPRPGALSATLFIELTTEEELREWLPKLVGIERSVELVVDGVAIGSIPEDDHESRLTREETTAAVHYIRWELDPEQVERFATGPVALRVAHANYDETVPVGDETIAELLTDLRE